MSSTTISKLTNCLHVVTSTTLKMSDKRCYSDMDTKSSNMTDQPPYSRLFIVCNKSVTEDCLRQEFEKFGNIEEIWMVKDRVSGEFKGVAYIKYSLTSEAARAMEEMNLKPLGNTGRRVKVMVAHSRGEGSKKEPLDEERVTRLFVVCEKSATSKDLEEHFGQFGQIDKIKLVKDRDSNENKGFAYIKYFKMSHAALAFEKCDRGHRPKFAEPKPQRFPMPDGFDSGASSYDDRSRMQYKMGHAKMPPVHSGGYPPDASGRLQVLVSPVVSQDQLWRLFDIAPGLEYCRIYPDPRVKLPSERLIATVQYATAQQASHARDKIHHLEYPPGQMLTVRLDREISGSGGGPSFSSSFPIPRNSDSLSQSDLAMLAENVKQATALLKAHSSRTGLSPSAYDPHYCTAKLPPARNFDDEDPPNGEGEGGEARVFVVFNPTIPERYAIKDVFGRFGRILDMFLLASKNVGYVTYARKESVRDAIATLHGTELGGMYMKVMEAEPRRSSSSQADDDRRKRFKQHE